MTTLWLNEGNIVTDASADPIDCDDCPCEDGGGGEIIVPCCAGVSLPNSLIVSLAELTLAPCSCFDGIEFEIEHADGVNPCDRGCCINPDKFQHGGWEAQFDACGYTNRFGLYCETVNEQPESYDWRACIFCDETGTVECYLDTNITVTSCEPLSLHVPFGPTEFSSSKCCGPSENFRAVITE